MKEKHIKMYMEMAECLARASSALKMKVGCIIVKGNNIISTGYNAQPAHIDGPLEDVVYATGNEYEFLDQEWIERTYPFVDQYGSRYKLVTKPTVRHAEKNALLGLTKSNESSVGGVMFCTFACCKLCAVDIVDAGIKEFYFKHQYRTTEGLEYLKANGVEVFETILNSDGFCVYKY